MDIISFNEAATANSRIEKFIENPDSTSGIVTVPKTIATGETVTVPAGRVAVLPNIIVDGTLNIDGEVFIPSGSSVDFSNGIKIDGKNIVLSIPTSYHLLQGNLSVSNEIITNGFSTTLYTGNGGTQSINTGIDMSTQWGNDTSEMFGGLVWLKSRSAATNNYFVDTVRGATKDIYSNAMTAETTEATGLTSFTSTGFNLGVLAGMNTNLATYVSWNFQTTHRRTGVTNHGKAYTEHYNPFTGFTIIKYEGSGLAGHEIPHSLGRKLGFVAFKNLTSTDYWKVATEYGSGFLEQNLALANSWGVTAISGADKVVLPFFNVLTNDINYSSQQYIMYGWANSYYDEANKLIGNYEVGVYQGTGVAGNKVTTRGKPAWIMVKRLDSAEDWQMLDNQRNDKLLQANAVNVEDSVDLIDIMIDGFILKTTAGTNFSGGQYLYMVVYDNDSGSGKSKYPKATDTTNVQINNAIIPLAHGVDSNGSKNSIVSANETITGLTYTQGKNYLYKTDTGYGVKPYEPRMLSSELVRRYAGEQPDYYDVDSNKWFNTDAGSELVTNGTFTTNTNGWTLSGSCVISNGTMLISNSGASASQTITGLDPLKKYKLKGSMSFVSGTNIGWFTVNGVTYGNVTANYQLDITMSGVSQIVLSLNVGTTAVYSFDNITAFPTDILPTTEITESRNYLNHIVHADQNGQVTYIEELPKIEYKDVIKANEYQGKNALIAYALVDMTTTPPTIKSSFNVSGCIRISSGVGNLYLSTPTDTASVSAICGSSAGGTVTAVSNSMITFATGTTNYALTNIYVFGGQQ